MSRRVVASCKMYEVDTQPLVWIQLKDGCRLAAALWLPLVTNGEKFPAILEYLPYRRNDFTALRDAKRHPWLSSRGYVVIRVDMRGSGDSDGLYYDEYEQQEQDDCVEVIQWIRDQQWCSGNVGMVGKSWGGFNSLQMAALNPEGLKAVISVCSTDDRYDDNSHFKQGCVVPSQMLSWSCYMLAWNSAPPDPLYVGSRWKEMWLKRLEVNEPWIHTWLSHPTRDKYWKHGSICEDYSKVKCAVFLIGGWEDTYRTAIFRMAENLSCDWRALIGPWPHVFPDECNPGPAIGYLQQCLRFWDYHLKGIDNGLDKEPRFRVYLQEGTPAAPVIPEWPGRWVAEDGWPSSNVSDKKYTISCSGLLTEDGHGDGNHNDPAPPFPKSISIGSSFSCGSAAGDLMPTNAPGQLPGDQGRDDGRCQCWHSAILHEFLDILGVASIEVVVSSDRPLATLCARLVDVFPDGTASLITTGVLNLTHHKGHTSDVIEPLQPAHQYSVQLMFDSIGYTVLPGHRIRLALSQSYWPNLIWPPPVTPKLLLHLGTTSCLTLPVRVCTEEVRKQDEALPDLGQPCFSPGLSIQELRKPSNERYFMHDSMTNSYRSVKVGDRGDVIRNDTKLRFGREIKEVYHITEDDPLSAKVEVETSQRVGRELQVEGEQGVFSTEVKTKTTMWADERAFYIDSSLNAWNGGTLVFEKRWEKRIERDV